MSSRAARLMASIAASVTHRRKGVAATEAEQDLGPTGRKSAPVRPTFFPPSDRSIDIGMSGPHAAMRAFPQHIAGRSPLPLKLRGADRLGRFAPRGNTASRSANTKT
jgi:hypothetical protein